jgi:hypothetical protein
MRSLLLLAPEPAHAEQGHGELFDSALIETVRSLSQPRPKLRTFVPWTESLAPLISVATLDSSPAFNPESREERQPGQLVPYFPDFQEMREKSRSFWQSSYLSLQYPSPLSPGVAMEQSVDAVITLGVPNLETPISAILERGRPILYFSALSRPNAFISTVGMRNLELLDLSADFSQDEHFEETSDSLIRELSWERGLEPFVPFGLLLQRWLDRNFPIEPGEQA